MKAMWSVFDYIFVLNDSVTHGFLSDESAADLDSWSISRSDRAFGGGACSIEPPS